MIEVELPDGTIAEFPDGTPNTAIEAALKRKFGKTSATEQASSGVNEGLSGMLGLPVDASTSLINLVMKTMTGGKLGGDTPYLDPKQSVGGSNNLKEIGRQTGLISEVDPQTTPQRYARRIGQEVGAMVIPAMGTAKGAMAAGSPLAKIFGLEGASAIGSGLGGQTAREIAPDSAALDFIMSMGGGLSPVAVSQMTRPKPSAPSLNEISDEVKSLYKQVDDAGARVKPHVSDEIASNVDAVIGSRRANPLLAKHSTAVGGEISEDLREKLQKEPTISEIDDLRKFVNKTVMKLDPQKNGYELEQGASLKAAIDGPLDRLGADDITGTANPQQTVDTLKDARSLYSRKVKAELLEGQDTGLIDKAKRRAAVSGRGGNELNAIRQNIARILGNPKLRGQFNKAELAQMRKIADGTPTTNALRHGAGLSPTTGSLTSMAGIGMTAANPLLSVPFVGGYIAKEAGEKAQKAAVNDLLDMIRNGGVALPRKARTSAETATIMSYLTGQASTPSQ